MLAEAPGWSKWWPNNKDGGNIYLLSLRGLPLFNILMGPIYFITYKNFESWTEVSEFICGFVTAVGIVGAYLCLSLLF